MNWLNKKDCLGFEQEICFRRMRRTWWLFWSEGGGVKAPVVRDLGVHDLKRCCESMRLSRYDGAESLQ